MQKSERWEVYDSTYEGRGTIRTFEPKIFLHRNKFLKNITIVSSVTMSDLQARLAEEQMNFNSMKEHLEYLEVFFLNLT